MTILQIANLVHETSTGTGTGNLTLTPYSQSFDQAFGNGATTDVFYYFIQHRTAAEWEWGTGHMSAATTLVRDTVHQSSNSNALVNFSAGTKDVCNDLPAANHTLIGNTGAIDEPVFSPGDPVNNVTLPGPCALAVSDYIVGDFAALAPSTGGIAAVALWPGFAHTGASPYPYEVQGVNIGPSINSTSTQDLAKFQGLVLDPINFGAGALTLFQGFNCNPFNSGGAVTDQTAALIKPEIDAGSVSSKFKGVDVFPRVTGTGTVANEVGINIRAPEISGGGAITGSACGFLIEDHSGLGISGGITDNLNMYSAGVNSMNLFAGVVALGTAAQADSGFSRTAAATVALGDGTAGNASGTLALTKIETNSSDQLSFVDSSLNVLLEYNVANSATWTFGQRNALFQAVSAPLSFTFDSSGGNQTTLLLQNGMRLDIIAGSSLNFDPSSAQLWFSSFANVYAFQAAYEQGQTGTTLGGLGIGSAIGLANGPAGFIQSAEFQRSLTGNLDLSHDSSYIDCSFDNTGASADITVTPLDIAGTNGSVGVRYSFCITAAHKVTVQLQNGATIYDGGTQHSANGTIFSSTPGSFIKIVARDFTGGTPALATDWVVEEKTGTWTFT